VDRGYLLISVYSRVADERPPATW